LHYLEDFCYRASRGRHPAWFLDLRPATSVEVEEAGGGHVLALLQLDWSDAGDGRLQ